MSAESGERQCMVTTTIDGSNGGVNALAFDAVLSFFCFGACRDSAKREWQEGWKPSIHLPPSTCLSPLPPICLIVLVTKQSGAHKKDGIGIATPKIS